MNQNNKTTLLPKILILLGLLLFSGTVLLYQADFSLQKQPVYSIPQLSSSANKPLEHALPYSLPKEEQSVLVSSPQVAEEIEDSPTLNHKKVYSLLLNSDRTIGIMGQIDDNALAAADIITDMALKSPEPIYLILSGPGGSVVTGSILIAAMQASRAPVYTVCHIFCASMDAMIHQFGKKRYVTDRTVMMFHPATAGTQGDVDRMYTFTKFLKRYINKIELYVAKRQKKTFDQYKSLTAIEYWIDAEDSVRDKVADGIVSFTLTQSFMDLQDNMEQRAKHYKKINSVVPDNKNPLKIQWICDKCKDQFGNVQWTR